MGAPFLVAVLFVHTLAGPPGLLRLPTRGSLVSAVPPDSSARATTSVAATVVRARTVSPYQRGGASVAIDVKPEADHAERPDRASSERCVDLAPPLQDVHLDDVGVALEREIPYMREDLGLRKRFAGGSDQVLEPRELSRRQRDRHVTATGSMSGRVEMEVPCP